MTALLYELPQRTQQPSDYTQQDLQDCVTEIDSLKEVVQLINAALKNNLNTIASTNPELAMETNSRLLSQVIRLRTRLINLQTAQLLITQLIEPSQFRFEAKNKIPAPAMIFGG